MPSLLTKRVIRSGGPYPGLIISPKIGWRGGNNARAIGIRKTSHRWFLLFYVAVFSFGGALSGGPIQAEESRMPALVRMGYSAKILSDVDLRDAQVAMDMLTVELNRIITGSKVSTKCIIFQDTTSMIEAINQQGIDMLTLTTLDYLRMKNRLYMDPFFVAANQVKDGQQRLLIVRKDRGINKVTQLKDRIVNGPSRLRDEISLMWLDTLLAREEIPERAKFFQQVREVHKASQAVLPVFFSQVDSALVKRSSFEMISALNLQLKEDLTILANSKSLLGDVFCVHKNLDESIKRALIEKAPKLHESPSGKQLFTLLQVDRIIPFQPSYLDNLVELEKEHRALPAGMVGRK